MKHYYYPTLVFSYDTDRDWANISKSSVWILVSKSAGGLCFDFSLLTPKINFIEKLQKT